MALEMERPPAVTGRSSQRAAVGVFGWREAATLALMLVLMCAVVLIVGFVGSQVMTVAWDGTQWVPRDTLDSIPAAAGPMFQATAPIP